MTAREDVPGAVIAALDQCIAAAGTMTVTESLPPPISASSQWLSEQAKRERQVVTIPMDEWQRLVVAAGGLR